MNVQTMNRDRQTYIDRQTDSFLFYVLVQVAVCIEYGVDQAADLEDMVKALRERCGSVELLVKEKLHIVSVSVDFHQNVQNVRSYDLRSHVGVRNLWEMGN